MMYQVAKIHEFNGYCRASKGRHGYYCPACGAFDLGLAVSVPLPIVIIGIFVLLWFQSRLT